MASVNPIQTTFEICDANKDNGLTMKEIQDDGCMETLDRLFGLTRDLLQENFLMIDRNMDNVITMEEGLGVSQSLERNLDCISCNLGES